VELESATPGRFGRFAGIDTEKRVLGSSDLACPLRSVP
jgi:hypothetical protein